MLAFSQPRRVPASCAHSLELVAEDRLLGGECANGVGELDLATCAALGRLQLVEDLGLRMYRPSTPRSDGASPTDGFSTRSSISTSRPSWCSGATIP